MTVMQYNKAIKYFATCDFPIMTSQSKTNQMITHKQQIDINIWRKERLNSTLFISVRFIKYNAVGSQK